LGGCARNSRRNGDFIWSPEILQELEAMARTSKKGPQFLFHLTPLAMLMRMQKVVQRLKVKEFIARMGVKKIIEEIGVKEVIEEIGVKKVIEEIGVKKVIAEVLTRLSDAERAALIRRLKAQSRK
jgi:Asp-tRNA(Asn)/Glu-tRNA(Gln) amidotransferase B subunit